MRSYAQKLIQIILEEPSLLTAESLGAVWKTPLGRRFRRIKKNILGN